MKKKTIELKELGSIMWNEKKLVISIVIIFFIASTAFNFFIEKPKYNANLKVYVVNDSTKNEAAASITSNMWEKVNDKNVFMKVDSKITNEKDGVIYQNLEEQSKLNDKEAKEVLEIYQNMIKTYLKPEDKKTLIKNVMQNLGLNISQKEIYDNLSIISKVGDSAIQITYIDSNSTQAKNIANSISATMINEATKNINSGNIKFYQTIKCSKRPEISKRLLNVGIITFLGIILAIGIAMLKGIKELEKR